MEIWILLNPAIKFLIYIASFTASGTVIFLLHFRQLLSFETESYCQELLKQSSFFGVAISSLLFLSVAGNLGGDLLSGIDPTMLLLATQLIPGKAAIISFIGFTGLYICRKVPGWIASYLRILFTGLIPLSFIIVGHSTKNGLMTQALIYIHLIGISYWIGSFLPLINIIKRNNQTELYSIANKFGQFAVLYIFLLLAAGSSFSYIILGDIRLLLTSNYGNILLIKMLVVAALLGFGALNKYRIVPKILEDPHASSKKLWRSINIEIIFALIIFLLTSILTTSVLLP